MQTLSELPTTDLSEPPSYWTRAQSRARRLPPIVLVVPALLIALLMVSPLVYLVLRATDSGASVPQSLFRARTREIAINTATLATAVAISATAVAVPLAWLTTRTNLPGIRWWRVAAGLPLVIPSYVGALTMIAALGPKGLLQGWLEGPLGVDRLPPIYGLFGSWLTLTLFTYPYVYLSVQAAFRGLDPALEEAARTLGLGPAATFIRSVLPQLRPAIASGALLAALYTVSDFGVVSLMRFDVFTRAIYVQYQSSFDRSAAAALALVLVVLTIVMVMGEGWLRGRSRQYRVATGSARRQRQLDLGRWRWLGVAYCAVVFVASVGLPIFVLVYWMFRGASAGDELHRLGNQAWNSVSLGILAAILTVAFALPTAILSVRYSTLR